MPWCGRHQLNPGRSTPAEKCLWKAAPASRELSDDILSVEGKAGEHPILVFLHGAELFKISNVDASIFEATGPPSAKAMEYSVENSRLNTATSAGYTVGTDSTSVDSFASVRSMPFNRRTAVSMTKGSCGPDKYNAIAADDEHVGSLGRCRKIECMRLAIFVSLESSLTLDLKTCQSSWDM